MEALYLLVPLSVGIVFVAIRVFFWMSDNGQFDDMVGPGLRILEDDEDPLPEPAKPVVPAPESAGVDAIAASDVTALPRR